MKILPRPVSPRSAFADLRDYLVEKRAHKWPLLGLSAALTYLIIWAFITDANTNTMPTRNQIIYIQNWNAGRDDAAIIMQQKLELAQEEVRFQENQRRMQKMADMFGVEWRKDEKRNTAERLEALKQINAQLDQRLARARAAENAETRTDDQIAATSSKPVPVSQ